MKRYIKASTISNTRKGEYDHYLKNHISGVQRAWRDILKPALFSDSESDYDLLLISTTIDRHDLSKYQPDEYDAYCDYFYPTESNPKDKDAFDRAWLLHQKRNPHHWQYWVLVRDEGELAPIDMPIEYICEMLCDWSSFHYIDPESTANKWYKDNKKKMIFSDDTRKKVEKLLELAPEL